MAVIAVQFDVRKAQGCLYDLVCLAGLDSCSKLGIHGTGVDLYIGMRIDTRGDTKQDILYDASAGGFCFYGIEFFKTVYDKMADSQLHGKGDICISLVVAVEKCLAQIIASLIGTEDLSAGDDIDPHSFFFHYLIYILKRICLAGIERTGISAEVLFESLGIGTAVLPDSLFVH